MPLYRVPLSFLLLLALAGCGGGAAEIPVVLHGMDPSTGTDWAWAGTPIREVFRPYTIRSIHVIEGQVAPDETAEVRARILGLIRSEHRFWERLSIPALELDTWKAVLLTDQGPLFLVQRCGWGGFYRITSGNHIGWVSDAQDP